MRYAVLLSLVLLASCTEPRAGVAIDAQPGAVSVSPTVSGNLGGLTVSVRG